MTPARGVALIAVLAAAQPALAFQPDLPPRADLTAEVGDPAANFGVAVGAAGFGSNAPEERLFGPRARASWRIPDDAPNSAVLAQAVLEQLAASGAEILFECSGPDCGGFDFRAGRAILPMPDMFVDLALYHYISARLPAAQDQQEQSLLEVIASESLKSLHIQVSRIDTGITEVENLLTEEAEQAATSTSSAPAPPRATTSGDQPAALDPGSVPGILERDGHAALDGLSFASGTATLESEEVPALSALAAYLIADPNRRISLVGHSDWTGDPSANRRLSEARAAAVAQALVDRYSVPRRQLEVFGAGDLSPRTSNATEEGRSQNRRVDAVARPPFGG